MALKENTLDVLACSDIVTHVTGDFIALSSSVGHMVEAIEVENRVEWVGGTREGASELGKTWDYIIGCLGL